eukprot:CAMPEP_0119392358 /NCGR_PEP_ID=MMETSP1334-20130426/120824_1 /TAXON_ID=127549 /ORGANISM="Calcidiscus leptoporus, Strain RCC1130" /LENGTH=159 /DNA_ID=CAMNT_0007415201 /DNA_START=144 /DNA_END=619 /DNA_ORIENTATION=+
MPYQRRGVAEEEADLLPLEAAEEAAPSLCVSIACAEGAAVDSSSSSSVAAAAAAALVLIRLLLSGGAADLGEHLPERLRLVAARQLHAALLRPQHVHWLQVLHAVVVRCLILLRSRQPEAPPCACEDALRACVGERRVRAHLAPLAAVLGGAAPESHRA